MKGVLILNIKKISHFVCRLYDTFSWVIQVVLKTDLKNHVRKVEGADTLTILANGPSLKDDMNKIDFSHGHFSVVNFFYKSPYYKMIKPAYYVIADPLFFDEMKYIMHLVIEVDWKMKLFVPYYAWKKIDFLKKNPNQNIEVIPYNTITYNGIECFRNYAYEKGCRCLKLKMF